MAKINANVHLQDPDGRRVLLAKGDEIPEWATVDEALIAKPGRPKKAAAAKKAPAKKVAAKANLKASPPREKRSRTSRPSST